jgi:hypothetical protein
LSEKAVVVNLGEAEVLKREVTEALHSFVGGKLPGSDLGEEMPEGGGVHRGEVHCREVRSQKSD